MFEFFTRLFRGEPSGAKAKERLRLVLLSDHLALAPDIVDSLKTDLLEVISRYVEVDTEHVDVTFEQREHEVAMLANVPILSVKNGRSEHAAASVGSVGPHAVPAADMDRHNHGGGGGSPTDAEVPPTHVADHVDEALDGTPHTPPDPTVGAPKLETLAADDVDAMVLTPQPEQAKKRRRRRGRRKAAVSDAPSTVSDASPTVSDAAPTAGDASPTVSP